jgi:hypothetical protein
MANDLPPPHPRTGGRAEGDQPPRLRPEDRAWARWEALHGGQQPEQILSGQDDKSHKESVRHLATLPPAGV